MRISILGVDYKSAIYAACLSARGHWVIGVDTAANRADLLNGLSGETLEPGLRLLLGCGREAGLLKGTTDFLEAIQETDLTFIDAVQTGRNESWMDEMMLMCRRLGLALRAKSGAHRLFLRSDAQPEKALALLLPILENGLGKRIGGDFQLEVSPDYLDGRNRQFPECQSIGKSWPCQ